MFMEQHAHSNPISSIKASEGEARKQRLQVLVFLCLNDPKNLVSVWCGSLWAPSRYTMFRLYSEVHLKLANCAISQQPRPLGMAVLGEMKIIWESDLVRYL